MSRRRHVNQSLWIIQHIAERFTSNVCHSLDSPKFDDITAHHAKEIVSHLMRSRNVVPLLYPFDMATCTLGCLTLFSMKPSELKL